jgi:predicted DNA-binding transcriptional regulator YafY
MYRCHIGGVRADRLLSLVLLLRRRGRMTAGELARELEVSVRTVLRDVEALSTAGVPVYAERGRDGGFALLPGFTTDLTGLTHDEALALLTAQSRATPDALGLGPAFAAAVRKVVAAMPESARRTATDAADRVLVRQQWRGSAAPETHLAVVRQAVFAGRRLRLRYRARGGPDGAEPARWRTVDPVGLVEAGGRWYLLATRDGADRTYRLSRVEDVEELDEPAHREPGTDLEKVWTQRRAAFLAARPTTTAAVRVRADRRAALASTALGIVAEQPEGSDTLRVDVLFGDALHAERALWSLGPDVEALGPEPLRAALAARAAAVAALYR